MLESLVFREGGLGVLCIIIIGNGAAENQAARPSRIMIRVKLPYWALNQYPSIPPVLCSIIWRLIKRDQLFRRSSLERHRLKYARQAVEDIKPDRQAVAPVESCCFMTA